MTLCNCNDKTIPSFHAKDYHKGADTMKTETVKHTPGPWAIAKGQGPYSERPENYQPWDVLAVDDDNEHLRICTLADDFTRTGEANARLIASGPELLEALKSLIQLITDGKLVRDISKDNQFMSFLEQSKELVTVLTNANIAITKAEGKA